MAELAFKTSPLEALRRRLEAASTAGGDGVTLREVPFLAQVNLRGDAGDPAFRRAVQRALGLDLPVAANTVARGRDLDALWLGPDEWLIVGAEDTADALVAGLRAALDGQHAAVVDVSANRTVLELAGPEAREVIMKGCTLDLHPRVFGPGRCAGTILSRVQVILEQRDDRPTYRLFVRGSFAIHLATWLTDAMGEYRD